jgi:transcriptional regulator with XRE-family HTH domain
MAHQRGSDDALAWNKVVGNNVRVERINQGMSQADIAKALGLSYQQLQKYENGANRISAGRLYEIAKILKIPVDRLFMGCTGGDELAVGDEPKDQLELRQDFMMIDSITVRAAISGLVKSLNPNRHSPNDGE